MPYRRSRRVSRTVPKRRFFRTRRLQKGKYTGRARKGFYRQRVPRAFPPGELIVPFTVSHTTDVHNQATNGHWNLFAFGGPLDRMLLQNNGSAITTAETGFNVTPRNWALWSGIYQDMRVFSQEYTIRFRFTNPVTDFVAYCWPVNIDTSPAVKDDKAPFDSTWVDGTTNIPANYSLSNTEDTVKDLESRRVSRVYMRRGSQTQTTFLTLKVSISNWSTRRGFKMDWRSLGNDAGNTNDLVLNADLGFEFGFMNRLAVAIIPLGVNQNIAVDTTRRPDQVYVQQRFVATMMKRIQDIQSIP